MHEALDIVTGIGPRRIAQEPQRLFGVTGLPECRQLDAFAFNSVSLDFFRLSPDYPPLALSYRLISKSRTKQHRLLFYPAVGLPAGDGCPLIRRRRRASIEPTTPPLVGALT